MFTLKKFFRSILHQNIYTNLYKYFITYHTLDITHHTLDITYHPLDLLLGKES